jgi:DNA-binding HxlR family transcriptional regulator
MSSEFRSHCPIACTLDLIGDRWTLLVIRDLTLGKERFEEFLASPEGISTNILSDRLKRLEELDLITKEPYGSHTRRMRYQLTPKGKGLKRVMAAITRWGLDNIEGTSLFDGTTEAEATSEE